MKNIKLFALATLLISGLGLVACSGKKTTPTPTPTVNPTPTVPTTPTPAPTPSVQPEGSVTVYLDLGEIGLYEGKKGNDFSEVFLENAIKIVGKPGDALPGADKITSTSGAKFESWMYYEEKGTGAPTKYEVLPNFDCILLANWSGGSGTIDPTPTTTPGPLPTGAITYTATDLPDWITNDGCVIFAWVWSPSDTGSWKACTYSTPATQLTFVVNEELTGFLLARCAAGTTQPDWNQKSDVAGRVYNKTSDITCTAGTYSYSASSWQDA